MKALDQTKDISPWQFTFFRILFGGYLAVHFAMLIPFAGELFGSMGLIADAGLNPTAGLFPTPFALPLSDTLCALAIGALMVLSLLFAGGIGRPWVAVMLWFGWSALFHRNNLIANPSIPYIGLLLLLCALVPMGEPLSRGEVSGKWSLPRWVWRCAWVLLAVGYTFSGWTKLSSPSWTDGSAMHFLLENPLARDGWMRDLMLVLPEGVLKGLTWLTLFAELLFLPLAIWRRSRPWIWLLLFGMHLGIIAVVDFADLSLGMLMVHLFTFDPAWLPARRAGRMVLAFDADCLMCSAFMRFLAREDRGKVLRFTALQGDRGRDMEARAGVDPLSGMLVSSDDRVLAKSSATLELLNVLGGVWRLFFWVGKMVPLSLRDRVYDAIASRRRRVTGVCGMPSDDVRERMLV